MQRDYLVFWYDGNGNKASVIRLNIPPHEDPVGTELEGLLLTALRAEAEDPLLNGAIELSTAAWSKGHRSVVVGEGMVGTIEPRADGWVLHL